MITVVLSTKRRRPELLWRRRFVLQWPESWSDLSHWERKRLWRATLIDANAARRKLLASRVPARWRRLNDAAAELCAHLDAGAANWVAAKSDCSCLPIERLAYKGQNWTGPLQDGSNMRAGEFAVCNMLYDEIAQRNDQAAANLLTWILYRPEWDDKASAAKRGDVRVPFYHDHEAKERLKQYGPPPDYLQAAAILYFSGLKAWLSRVYGSYIFDQSEDDDVQGEETAPQEASEPNFGWFGVLQQVAESGVFGSLEQVYQTTIHEVCIFLVRQRVQADRVRAMAATQHSANDEDLY